MAGARLVPVDRLDERAAAAAARRQVLGDLGVSRVVSPLAQCAERGGAAVQVHDLYRAPGGQEDLPDLGLGVLSHQVSEGKPHPRWGIGAAPAVLNTGGRQKVRCTDHLSR